MKFNLVFENSGDTIPFEVYANHDLFEHFVDQLENTDRNWFSNHLNFSKQVDSKTQVLRRSVAQVNDVLNTLINTQFQLDNDVCISQNNLNQLHCAWAKSQENEIDIDALRFSEHTDKNQLGKQLHELYPDNIRTVYLGEVLSKLNLSQAYHLVNIGVHQLESTWQDTDILTFTSGNRYDKIHHQFENLYANNDSCHFSFAYTFVGRQYYDKFLNYDTELQFDDHYNYQYLEHTFNLSLRQKETRPFGNEFLNWCNTNNVPPIGNKLPIANITNLNRLTIHDYVKLLYRNIANDNHVYIDII